MKKMQFFINDISGMSSLKNPRKSHYRMPSLAFSIWHKFLVSRAMSWKITFVYPLPPPPTPPLVHDILNEQPLMAVYILELQAFKNPSLCVTTFVFHSFIFLCRNYISDMKMEETVNKFLM